MLKNKKGFTFVEILAAITILGILTGVAVVAVSNIIENGKKEHYETAEKNLSLAGQSYVQTNRAYLPKAIGQKTKIKLSTLVEKNYIQPIKDYSDNNCDMEASYVQVFKYSQNDYSYVPVLKCGSNGDVYDGTKDSQTTYDPEITAQIVVDQEKSSAEAQVTIQGNDKLMSYSYIVYRGSKEVKNSGSVSVKGFKESVSFKIPLTDYTPGKLKVVISATNIYGNDDTLTVTKTVADTKAPTCIIKLEDELTSAKEWKTGTRKITVGCDDAPGKDGYLLRPHRFFRFFCGSGGNLRAYDHRRLRPGHAGILSPVSGVCAGGISAVCLAGWRQGRGPADAAAYSAACHGVFGHLFFRCHHTHEYGGSGGYGHFPGGI